MESENVLLLRIIALTHDNINEIIFENILL